MPSLPLSVTALAVSSIVADDLGVVTNHVGALVDLGVDLLAVLGHNLLALLGVGGVDLNVVFLVTLLPLLLLLTLRPRGVTSPIARLGLGDGAGEGGSGQKEGGANLVHHLVVGDN